MNIGVHVSIRKGYLEAARTAHRIGARAFQYFPKNPRSLALKQLDVRDASAAAQYCRQHGIVSVAHAPYPTNPAVDDPMRREKVARSLLNDLMIAEACGSLGVVVHFGYSSAADPLQGYKNVLLCLNDVLARWNGRARILLENEAGGHGPMGTRLEEMVQIRRLSDRPERIGFCFDTCHAFQSGEWPDALDTFATWEKRARESGYFRHVEVIHVNDSAYPYASRRDRHANIGHGRMDVRMIARFLRMRDIAHAAFILETPVSKAGGHVQEMQEVASLASAEI